jgi:hypothetical protein
MPDPTGERDHSEESNVRSSDDSGSRHGERRRRRHRRKKEKPTSKVAVTAITVLLLITAAAVFLVARPHLMRRLPAHSAPRAGAAATSEYVAFGRQTVIIMNPTDKDWPHTTVTVNGEYKANCPEIPKGSQFEIWFKNFRGPKREFDAKTDKVQSVKIEPEGQEAIEWKPPIE